MDGESKTKYVPNKEQSAYQMMRGYSMNNVCTRENSQNLAQKWKACIMYLTDNNTHLTVKLRVQFLDNRNIRFGDITSWKEACFSLGKNISGVHKLPTFLESNSTSSKSKFSIILISSSLISSHSKCSSRLMVKSYNYNILKLLDAIC